jgi:hypothetical protein
MGDNFDKSISQLIPDRDPEPEPGLNHIIKLGTY